MKKALLCMAVWLGGLLATPCAALEMGRAMLTDTLFGAVAGAAVGAAAMAFSGDPGEHPEFLALGVAAGAVAGAGFGAWDSGAMATFENGRIRMAFPTIRAAGEKVDKPHKAFKAWADIIRVRF